MGDPHVRKPPYQSILDIADTWIIIPLASSIYITYILWKLGVSPIYGNPLPPIITHY